MLENICMDTKEERVGGVNWKIDTDVYIYTLLILCIKMITSENLLYSSGNSVLCANLNWKEILKRSLCAYI